MSEFPPQNERLFDRPNKTKANQPARPALAWTSLVLSVAALIVSVVCTSLGVFSLSGMNLSYAAIAAILVALVVAAIAVRRWAQPRWAAMGALVISVVALLPTLGVILLTGLFLFAFLAR